MSSWGIRDISIRLTTFTGDGFSLDFKPTGRTLSGASDMFNSYIMASIFGISDMLNSHTRASLFQLDLNTSICGAYSSTRKARYHWNFITNTLDEDGYWACVENKQRSRINI